MRFFYQSHDVFLIGNTGFGNMGKLCLGVFGGWRFAVGNNALSGGLKGGFGFF
jgi:hypothetical protein